MAHDQQRPLPRRHPWILACAPLGGLLLLLGCSSNTASPARPGVSAAAASPATATSASPAAITKSQCDARPDPAGDLLVRVVTNGQPPVTQQLGGGWTWDKATRTCDTAVQMIMSAAPATGRSCTQVAWAADNRGYKLSAVPARPLINVIAAKGRAC